MSINFSDSISIRMNIRMSIRFGVSISISFTLTRLWAGVQHYLALPFCQNQQPEMSYKKAPYTSHAQPGLRLCLLHLHRSGSSVNRAVS